MSDIQDIDVLGVQTANVPEPSSALPAPTQTLEQSHLDIITHHLQEHFPSKYDTLVTIRTGNYGMAYVHCSTARYITDMCIDLGMTFGRRISPADISGVPFQVDHSHVAACFGVQKVTFANMRTTLGSAQEAHRLLQQRQQVTSLSEHDNRFLQILDAILGDQVLEEPPVHSGRATSTGPSSDAVKMNSKEFATLAKDVISRLGRARGVQIN
jgi:hypothetical protein